MFVGSNIAGKYKNEASAYNMYVCSIAYVSITLH